MLFGLVIGFLGYEFGLILTSAVQYSLLFLLGLLISCLSDVLGLKGVKICAPWAL